MASVAKKFLRTGGGFSLFDIMMVTFQLEKFLVAGTC